MRKIVLSLHVTLDGFVAGPNGEMDWIRINDELFDFTSGLTANADTALYGRVTYQMMENYWPTAADQPSPSKHDIEHSTWYNNVDKVVISKTMKGQVVPKTHIVSVQIDKEVQNLKNQKGKDILIFGSPRAAHSLMEFNLIDEYMLFVNPVILGRGIPVFAKIDERIDLRLLKTKSFSCGVTCLNYCLE